MYKQFVKMWAENFQEEEIIEPVEEKPIEKSKVTFLPLEDFTKLERKTRVSHRKSRTYVDYEKDFARLKVKVKTLENSLTSSTFLRRKKSFKEKTKQVNVGSTNIKKLQTFKYLVLSTITSNTFL